MKKIINILSIFLMFSLVLCGCTDKIKFQNKPIDREKFNSSVIDPGINGFDKITSSPILTNSEIEDALDFVIEKINYNLDKYYNSFPTPTSTNYMYGTSQNNEWTEGFWTGLVWTAYEYTNNIKYHEAAMAQCQLLKERLENDLSINHHDIGFLYYLSCAKGYEITGDDNLKTTAISAADKLLTRYNEKGKYIQAWGTYGEHNEQRLIIDCMMNLELLYWAYNTTGDIKYYDAAYQHAKTTAMVITREDASTYHTFYINPRTGNPSHGVTAQGISDDSAWARGQAWGIYGFAISYNYTMDSLFMEEGSKITNYFLNHLPEDNVCYWDLSFVDGDEPRDTSAAAIAASGLILASDIYNNEYNKAYEKAANVILHSLADKYTTKDIISNGILRKGVYSKPSNIGVNESLIWGDYYYAEALLKLYNKVN